MTEMMGLEKERERMTDFEKVVMLMTVIETMKNPRGCWCEYNHPSSSHTRVCRDTQAAMWAAAYGMPEMETVKEGAD